MTALILCIIFVVGCFTVNAAATDGAGATTGTGQGASSSETPRFDTEEMLDLIDAITYSEYFNEYKSQPAATDSDKVNVDVINHLNVKESDAKFTVWEKYNGRPAVMTPGTGTVAWTVKVDKSARYTISIDYSVDSSDRKANAVERIFRIDGKVPFSEARYVTIKKNWVSDYELAHYTGKDDPAVVLKELTDAGLKCSVNNGVITVSYPDVWSQKVVDVCNKHGIRFFKQDIHENELRPETNSMAQWETYTLSDSSGYYTDAFEFYFEAGKEYTISLEGRNCPLYISGITLGAAEPVPTYKEYLEALGSHRNEKGQGSVQIEAEYVDAASDKTVYPIEDGADPLTYPNDASRTMLNTIGGEKWQTAGQWVTYKFTVNKAGMYDIVTRFRQNVLDGMFVNRALYLYSDDAVKEGEAGYYNGAPFSEARALTYNYGDEWQITQATDGKTEFEFYFKAGVVYTLKLEVTLGEMGDIISTVQDALNAINKDYLDIIQLTGATPDTYRDYGFSRIMPDTLIDMVKQAKVLNNETPKAGESYGVAQKLTELAGQKSSNVGTLQKISDLLLKMGRDEDEIARSLERLKSYIGTLGTFLSDAKTQPLQLDYILIQPAETEEPAAKAGFFKAFWHEVCRFFWSFFRDYDSMGAMVETGEDSLQVWLATGRDQAQVKRSLVNDKFTAKSGIAVELKLVAGGTLLPSILAKKGPDVYHGLGQGDVINYAIRTAILPIEDCQARTIVTKDADGKETTFNVMSFAEASSSEYFNQSAMQVLGMKDAEGVLHYYGLPEAQGFSMMFVRVDILADLGLGVPETWDDIMEAIPHLQARNMEMGLTTDANIHLYQMGGELFADDGMRINLDSQVGLAAFKKMCELFTKYSFPYTYDAANRFRTGEMPILIGDYTGLYNQLKVFATEIEGLWTMVHVPGVRQEDGSIDYSAISSASASVMVRGSEDMKDDAWAYIQWFTGEECQADYANEMVAIMGPSAKYNTANVKALSQLPWTTEEYAMIQDQFTHLASVPNYPGSYIIARYTDFAFLAAYNSGEDPTQALLSYISIINKEITRKRAEFGLETLEAGQTLASKRMDQAEAAAIELEKKNSSRAELVERIKNAVKSEEEVTLRTLSEEIMAMNGVAAKASQVKISLNPDITDKDETWLLYYIATALADAANALATY